MPEFSLLTFFGAALALIPASTLLMCMVQVRITAALGAEVTTAARARHRLLRRAALASGFAITASALVTLGAGASLALRIAAPVPLLALMACALAAKVVAAAMVTVESTAALRERGEPTG